MSPNVVGKVPAMVKRPVLEQFNCTLIACAKMVSGLSTGLQCFLKQTAWEGDFVV